MYSRLATWRCSSAWKAARWYWSREIQEFSKGYCSYRALIPAVTLFKSRWREVRASIFWLTAKFLFWSAWRSCLWESGTGRLFWLRASQRLRKLEHLPCCASNWLRIFSRFDVFTLDFWGTLANNLGGENAPGTVPEQIINCFMVMMWVFVGMEGASVLGHRAERKSDVSKATIMGATALVVIYVAASVLPYGFLAREELMRLGSPSMAYIFQEAVGPWGGAFISGGLIISILGAWLSYTILASEAMHTMAKMELLPSMFIRLNGHGAPTACLMVTGTMIQLLAIVMLFSDEAYQFAYSLCTASIVISWTLAAAYMVRWAWPRRGEGQLPAAVLAAFACVFLVAAVLLAGIDLLALCCIIYVPGIVFFVQARRERGAEPVMTGRERALAAFIAVVAVAAVVLLATGAIAI